MLISKGFSIRALLSAEKLAVSLNQSAEMRNFKQPPKYPDIELPERRKLPIMQKVPQYGPSQRPFKMQKKLRLMRGPETIHTDFIHKQFGIVATGGGRLKHQHFEMVRMFFLRHLDFDKKVFAMWRVDAPWQPVTKKGQGQRMGGGKGAIDHYATPIKAGKVIIEVGGHVEYEEVRKTLENVAARLPFKAKATTHELLQKEREEEISLELNNKNPWTFKYLIQNNLCGCHNWISPFDKAHYGKYR